MPVPELRSARVFLRPYRPGDVDERMALGRDPEISRMYGGSFDPARLGRETIAAEIEKRIADPLSWAIEVDGRFIGGIGLHSLDETDKRARLAIGISDASKLGQGLGTEAVMMLLSHAFGTMKLHRVDLRVLEYNHRAIRSYEKCGFRVEGRERDSALVDGQWYDDVIMGILAHEFADAQDRNQPVVVPFSSP